MEIMKMTERHALKFAALGVAQQQRVMRNFERKARQYSQDKTINNIEGKESARLDAKQYEWQRRVRLSREGRAIHLIRAFLKGTPYKKVESDLKFHTLSPKNVVQDYMPFSHSMMQANFIKEFCDWLAE